MGRPKTPAGEQLYSVEAWATLLGVSPATAYRRVAAGEVERIDIGTPAKPCTRISESAHRRYIEAHRVTGPRTRRSSRVAA